MQIALVAHDKMKPELIDWAKANRASLAPHKLYATGTTGKQIVDATGLDIELLKSGPLGGDAQLGAKIADGDLQVCVFFIDPLSALPHDVDVKALIRLAILYNVMFAVNHATADAILKSL